MRFDRLSMKEKLLTNPKIIKLGDHIQQEVIEWYGSNANLVSTVPEVSIRPYSIFLRYGISTDTDEVDKFILLKIVRRPEMGDFNKIIANEVLQKEGLATFQSMKRLYELKLSSSDKPFFAILPLAYIKQWNAIVMEEAQQIREFKPKIGYLFNFPLSLHQARWEMHKPLIPIVGDWLHSFHCFGSSLQEVNCAKQFQLAVSTELAKWEQLGSLPAGVVNMLDELHPFLAGIKTKTTQIHGDLNLVNIVFDKKGNVGAIDPHSCRLDSIYVDLAHFIVDPLLQKWQVFTGEILLNRSRYREYVELFLKGYFGNYEPSLQTLYAYACLEFLKKWRMNEEKLLNKHRNRSSWTALNTINRWYFLRKFTTYWRYATKSRQQE